MENNELVGGESLNDLFKIKENLQKLTQYQDEYRPIYARLKNIYYETEDIYDTLKKKVGRLEYDPSLLDSLIERNRAINNIKKKYQNSVE